MAKSKLFNLAHFSQVAMPEGNMTLAWFLTDVVGVKADRWYTHIHRSEQGKHQGIVTQFLSDKSRRGTNNKILINYNSVPTITDTIYGYRFFVVSMIVLSKQDLAEGNDNISKVIITYANFSEYYQHMEKVAEKAKTDIKKRRQDKNKEDKDGPTIPVIEKTMRFLKKLLDHLKKQEDKKKDDNVFDGHAHGKEGEINSTGTTRAPGSNTKSTTQKLKKKTKIKKFMPRIVPVVLEEESSRNGTRTNETKTRESQIKPKSEPEPELPKGSSGNDTNNPEPTTPQSTGDEGKILTYHYKINKSDDEYTLELNEDKTVKDLKEAIAHKHGVENFSDVNVLFAGKNLLNEIVVSTLDVGDSLLFVWIRSNEDTFLMTAKALKTFGYDEEVVKNVTLYVESFVSACLNKEECKDSDSLYDSLCEIFGQWDEDYEDDVWKNYDEENLSGVFNATRDKVSQQLEEKINELNSKNGEHTSLYGKIAEALKDVRENVKLFKCPEYEDGYEYE